MNKWVGLGSVSFFLLVAVSNVKPQLREDVIPSALLAEADYGRIPLQFIPNAGQVDGRVSYYVAGRDKTIYFTSEGLTFVINGPRESALFDAEGSDEFQGRMGHSMRNVGMASVDFAGTRDNWGGDPGSFGRSPDRRGIAGKESSGRWVVKLDFLGANPEVAPESLEDSGAVISYFKGKPEDWKAGLAAASKIIYRELWPGIDLVYYGTVDRMKYEFIVHPGADPSVIRLAYQGAENVELTDEGRLAVETPLGGFKDDVPVAWQDTDGGQIDVAVAYVLEDVDGARYTEFQSDSCGPMDPENNGRWRRSHVYGFEVGEYDQSRPLVLDPAVLVYCGYIGGTKEETGYGIAVDNWGNAYIAGTTLSTEESFPVVVGPDLIRNSINGDAFVAKVNASGDGLVYCGYIGGSDKDRANGIAVDAAGNAYVTGETYSTEATFPVVNGPGLMHRGANDVFVAKVNVTGTGLVYCGYIGGSYYDYGKGIAVDGSGNAYVVGTTSSFDDTFPVIVGPGLNHNGYDDAFVAKVNSSGTALIYSGFIGGSRDDYGMGIAVDGSGNAYVTGYTFSTEATFPVVAGPDLTYNGNVDAFAAKIDSSGATLVYCGYIGGDDLDRGNGIAVDNSGNAYITGDTDSTEEYRFPVKSGPDLTFNGIRDAFVAKINPSGSELVYCGYVGGSGRDFGHALAVDGSGNVYITGLTHSSEATFPVIGGPDLTFNDWTSCDAFIAKVNSAGTSIIYCGYIGGGGPDEGYAIAVDNEGNAYITGSTFSGETTFPVVGGPDLTFNGGYYDAFVAKVAVAYTISGIVTSGGSGLQNVVMAGLPGNPATNASGNYTATVPSGWSGSATPTLAGYTFTPAVRNYSNVTANQTAQNYTAAASVTAPPTPASITYPTSSVTGNYTVSWAASTGATSYRLARSPDGGTTWVTIYTGANTSYAQSVPNGSYRYRVRAENSGGNSAYRTGTWDCVVNLSPTQIGLNRTQLNFGSVISGPKTDNQIIIISNLGGGTLNWTAAGGAAWLGVTPASGTGTGQVTVSVNPAGLAAGTYSSQVTFTALGATNSPQAVNVRLRVYAAGSTMMPIGAFDTPANGATVYGAIPVTGWALDDVQVQKVEIKRSPHATDPAGVIGMDGLVFISDAIFVEGARPDVEAAFPQHPLQYRAGWGYMLLTNMLPNQGNDTFTLHAFAYDKEGTRVKLGQKTIIGNNTGAVKPFGAIDTPAQGEQISGAAFSNFGWALTPQPNMIPIDGSTIGVWVDGVNLGHPAYNYARPSLAALFPGLANTSGPVGLYVLDTTAYANGVHTIAWSVVDSGGNAEGIGSRYFSILNAGGAEIEGAGSVVDQTSGSQDGLRTGRRQGTPRLEVTLVRSVLDNIATNMTTPVYVTKGYDMTTRPDIVHPDLSGVVDIVIKEVERIELLFGAEALEKALRSGRFSGRDAGAQPHVSSDWKPGESTGRGFGAGAQPPASAHAQKDQSKDRAFESMDEGFSSSALSGFLVVGDELRPLPIGSTLDPASGLFAWQPGPGFLGEYVFVFVHENSGGNKDKTFVRVTIEPKF